MNTESIIRLCLCAVALWYAIRPWWDRWRTRDWPTTPARIIDTFVASRGFLGKIDPLNNLQPAYAIEYEAGGRRYELGIDADLSFGINDDSFAFRKLLIPRQFDVRYRKGNPREFCVAHAYTLAAMFGLSAPPLLIAILMLFLRF